MKASTLSRKGARDGIPKSAERIIFDDSAQKASIDEDAGSVGQRAPAGSSQSLAAPTPEHNGSF